MATLAFRIYQGITQTLGGARGIYLRLGIAALIAMGVHLASQLLVDSAFVALGVLDQGVETVVNAILSAFEATGLPEEGWAAKRSYAFALLIDFETRESWSRVIGLVAELCIDFFLVRAALGYAEPTPRMWSSGEVRPGFRGLLDTTRIRFTRFQRSVGDYFRDITVEKVYLPISTLCAIGTGCYAIQVATENVLFAWLSPHFSIVAEEFFLTTSLPAIGIALVLVWRLGWPMMLHVFAYAEARSERMQFAGTKHRRLKGLVPAALVLPVMIAAVFLATPLAKLLGLS